MVKVRMKMLSIDSIDTVNMVRLIEIDMYTRRSVVNRLTGMMFRNLNVLPWI